MNYCKHGADDLERIGGEACQVCLTEEVAKKDEQIESLTQVVSDLEDEISELQQGLDEDDEEDD